LNWRPLSSTGSTACLSPDWRRPIGERRGSGNRWLERPPADASPAARGRDRAGFPDPRTASTRRPAPADRSARPASPRARRSHLDAAHTARPHRSDPASGSRHREPEISLCHLRWFHAKGDQRVLVLSEVPGRGRPDRDWCRPGRTAGRPARTSASRGEPGVEVGGWSVRPASIRVGVDPKLKTPTARSAGPRPARSPGPLAAGKAKGSRGKQKVPRTLPTPAGDVPAGERAGGIRRPTHLRRRAPRRALTLRTPIAIRPGFG